LDAVSKGHVRNIIVESLVADNFEINKTGLKIVCNLFEKKDFLDSHVKEFCDVADPILKLVQKIYALPTPRDQGSSEVIAEIFKHVSQIIEHGGKIFKNQLTPFVDLLYLQWSADSTPIYPEEKSTIEGILLDFCEIMPNKLLEDSSRVKKIIEVVCCSLAPESIEVSHDWLNPQSDIEEVEPSLRLQISKVDRLLNAFDTDVVLKFLSMQVEILLGSEDWRKRVAGLFSLSQVGEYLSDIDLVNPLITVLIQLVVTDQHPKIRYGVYHCIGQLAQDLAPKFQCKFFNDLSLVLINGMNDKIPRVKAHALCALTNFNEGCELDMILEKSDIMIHSIVGIIKVDENSILVRKCAIACLTSLMRALRHECDKYYDELIPF
jgi:hypothetical protein